MQQFMNIFHCPIWGDDFTARGQEFLDSRDQSVHESDRTAGPYHINGRAVHQVESLTSEQKAQLTTWLVDQRVLGVEMPLVTEDVVEYAVARRRLTTHERAMRLLRFMTRHTNKVSDQVALTVYRAPSKPGHVAFESGPTNGSSKDYNGIHLRAMAWTESTEHTEVFYLANYLENEGFVTKNQIESALDGPVHSYQITVTGHSRVEELETSVDSSQVFVAMWFDPSMEEAFKRGIRPGIEEAGYKAVRIDTVEHTNKVDDQIIAEIRRSRFLVADFTQGRSGARGNVYYEAGFAEGLGLRVIYTCKKGMIKKLAFDTRQYPHIEWETPDQLRIALSNRIRSVFGDGPLLYSHREQP